MHSKIRISFAQLNPKVGAINKNKQKILDTIKNFQEKNITNLFVFPELFITGYPPEDLLFRNEFYQQINTAVSEIKESSKNIHCIFGLPRKNEDKRHNATVHIHNQKVEDFYYKNHLPNTEVFDEKRYFTRGDKPLIITINKIKIAVIICEDFWYEEIITNLSNLNADLIISVHASPFEKNKHSLRLNKAKYYATKYKLPIFYLNTVGAQDDLIFDGGSFGVAETGEILFQGDFFKENVIPFTVDKPGNQMTFKNNITSKKLKPNPLQTIYDALTLGLKDYVTKNGCKEIYIGLSGGIDSALSAVIACDAVGAKNVHCIMMPTKHTTNLSKDLSLELAGLAKPNYKVVDIEKIYQDYCLSLNLDDKTTVTKQNIQARIRGNILMALANNNPGSLVIATGNRSELATGYCTLYGDMVGAFCVLKDVFKTDIYNLVKYRNKISKVIPEGIIKRTPTAELSDNQTDQDSLPPYDVLDKILYHSINEEKSVEEIVTLGFEEATVIKVVEMIYKNEFKRKQSAPGVRLENHSFSRDRRYPITSGFLR